MGRIEFRILGSADLSNGDGAAALSVLSQPKRVALLTYLAVNASGSFVRRDTLCAVLWPDAEQGQARHRLRSALHMLRRALGSEAIERRGDEEVSLSPQQVWCDVGAFEEAVRDGDHDRALELYRGDFLEGFHVEASNDFEDWVHTTRERLKRAAASSAKTLSREAMERGDAEAAVGLVERALTVDALDEEALRMLLQGLDHVGRRADAIRVYEQFARRLADDWSTEPAPETRAALDRIRDRSEPLEVASYGVAGHRIAELPAEPGHGLVFPGRGSSRAAGLTAGLAFAGAAFFVARVAQTGPEQVAQPAGVSLLAYLASWLIMVVGLWFLFERAEETATPEGRARIAAWLRPRLAGGSALTRSASTDPSASTDGSAVPPAGHPAQLCEAEQVQPEWAEGFIDAFDRIFGPHHFSLHCFLRSMAMSVVSVTVVLLLWIGIRPDLFSRFAADRGISGLGELVLITFLVNVVADYLSLLETRSALILVKRWESTWARTLVLVGDALATFVVWLTFYAGLPFLLLTGVSATANDIMLFIQFQLWGYAPTIYEVMTLSAREGGPPVGIWFYSTFVTSIWLWLYLSAGQLSRATQAAGDVAGRGLAGIASVFDAEQQPFRVLGLAAAALVTVAYGLGLLLQAL